MYKRMNLIKIKDEAIRYLRLKLAVDMPISNLDGAFDKSVKRYIKLYQSFSLLRMREEVEFIRMRKYQIKGMNFITLFGALQAVIWPVIKVAMTDKESDWTIEIIFTVFPYAIYMALAFFIFLGGYWLAQIL